MTHINVSLVKTVGNLLVLQMLKICRGNAAPEFLRGLTTALICGA